MPKQTRKRRLAGCVPLSADHLRCLLITSRHYPNHLVFPKGGIKRHETAQQAAARETWEECGALGTIEEELFFDTEEIQSESELELVEGECSDTTTASSRWFVMVVDRVEDDYPEHGQRLRQWHLVKEARHLHNLRPTTRALLDTIHRLYQL